MQTTLRILIVERDPVAGQALQQTLERHGHCAEWVGSSDDAIDRLEQSRASIDHTIGVVLADQDTAGMSPDIGLVHRLRRGWPTVVPILISGFRKVESAVQAMRLGAADYLLKPIVEDELIDAIGRAVQRHLLLVEHELVQEPCPAVQTNNPDAPAGGEKNNDEQDDDAGRRWTPMPLSEAMKGPERRILLAALEANGWNRGQTAKQLDINRTTLYKKIRQYRLDEPA